MKAAFPASSTVVRVWIPPALAGNGARPADLMARPVEILRIRQIYFAFARCLKSVVVGSDPSTPTSRSRCTPLAPDGGADAENAQGCAR